MSTENKGPDPLMIQKEQMILQAQIEQPKASVNVFELPCGYLSPDGTVHSEVVLREMTGREEDLLAAKKTDYIKKMNELFVRCIERLGSLTDKSQIAMAVPELLIGDRAFLMFAIRRVTLGDEYPFVTKCPECEKESLVDVDLSEITVKPMKEPSKRSYDGCIVDLQGQKTKTFRFHLLTGKDESRLSKVEDPDKRITQSMQMRLDMFNEGPVTQSAIEGLSMRERAQMRDAFDQVDGGIDTTVELSCPKCDHEYTTDLETNQSGFFFPSATRRNSKKKSST